MEKYDLIQHNRLNYYTTHNNQHKVLYDLIVYHTTLYYTGAVRTVQERTCEYLPMSSEHLQDQSLSMAILANDEFSLQTSVFMKNVRIVFYFIIYNKSLYF